MSKTDSIEIYTDGSSLGNPGPGGWGAVVIFQDSKNPSQSSMFYGEKEIGSIKNIKVDQVTELGGYEKHTTNNRMELSAVINALEFLNQNISPINFEIVLSADSAYVLNGITKWVFGWQKNNWKTSTNKEVLNRDLWERLFDASKNLNIKWNKVKGHSGVDLNERCDVLATSFAKQEEIDLFTGDYETYISIIPKHFPTTAFAKKKTPKGGFYISKIGDVVLEHKTWEECEAYVKGEKGAKYKKVSNTEEAKEIINSWK